MSDRAFAKKRPRWLVWLPTLVVVAIIAAAGVLAWQVSSGSIGRDEPPSVEEAVTQDGYSRFSDGGLTYIQETLQARVDLSEPSPEASELGLPADGDTQVQFDGFSFSVGLYVGEESIRIPTSLMTLTAEGGRLVGITLETSADGYQGQSALLASVVERFGMDDTDLADLDAQIAEDVRADVTSQYAFGPGADFGRPATATVDVNGADGTALTVALDYSS